MNNPTELLTYAAASLRLDAALLRRRQLPARTRSRLLLAKHIALTQILRGRPSRLPVGRLNIAVRTLSDLGTVQSAIIDVHDELVLTGVLHPNEPARVIDVGANIGQFAAAVLLHAPKARLTCFEPDPTIHTQLHANLDRAAETLPYALLDQTGTQPLHRHQFSVMSSLRPDSRTSYSPHTLDVSVTTLDASLPDADPIDILKIDVEGAEWEVLAGAHQTLARTRHLLIELSLARTTEHPNLDVIDQIRQACPEATIRAVGRPLGPTRQPTCQDLLIDLHPNQ